MLDAEDKQAYIALTELLDNLGTLDKVIELVSSDSFKWLKEKFTDDMIDDFNMVSRNINSIVNMEHNVKKINRLSVTAKGGLEASVELSRDNLSFTLPEGPVGPRGLSPKILFSYDPKSGYVCSQVGKYINASEDAKVGEVMFDLKSVVKMCVDEFMTEHIDELKGLQGDSTYTIAVRHGYKGSELDYIEKVGNTDLTSLKGRIDELTAQAKSLRKGVYKTEYIIEQFNEKLMELEAVKKTMADWIGNSDLKEYIHIKDGMFTQNKIKQ